MIDGITLGAPDIDSEDERAVLAALRSGILALGPNGTRFEELCAGVAGTAHAVAVSSGTAALHLIAEALPIGPGDTILVPSFTFVASVNSILYAGATPRFVDVEPDTYNIDPEDLEAKATGARGLIGVDMFGHPADWDAMKTVADRHDLLMIDDSCEALGSRYRDRPAGSFGAAGAFAFYPNKQITTGEGGMIVTDDDELADVCRSYRNQGRGAMGAGEEHERLGFNYRMDELSAALGVSQIQRLETFRAERAQVAAMYGERLAALDWVRPPVVRDDVEMSWFVYVVTLAPDIDRGGVMDRLASEGIQSRAYFAPVHLQPYIRERFTIREGMLPVTEDVGRRTLALPFHNKISETQVDRVVDALTRAVRAARSRDPR
jgi:dTDP-4-amino-4,6-dideoxygalactose transaminase